MNTLYKTFSSMAVFQKYCILLLMLLGTVSNQQVNAQISVCPTHVQNNGASSITFNVQNTNSYPIVVTTLSCYIGSGSQAIQILYNPTAINSSGSTWTQGIVGAGQNGWVSAYSATQTIATAGVNTISNSLFILIPAGATYGFGISSTSVSYMSLTAGAGVNVFTNGGVSIKTGDNISWGGGTYPSTPVNYPRGFQGCIGFIPYGPCIDPPTAGTTAATSTNICQGQSTGLSLNGGTGGTGQSYQWQSSASSSGPWTNVGPLFSLPSTYTVSPTIPTYYRCQVTCGANSDFSNPLQIFVPTPFPAGNYTINSALPTGGTNFQSFTAAVSAISCGIAGPVTFDVDPASGPYTEQITLPSTIGANAVNTVTFNGNGRTIQFNSTNSNARSIITLNGADYITFNDLTLDCSAAAATYGWGILCMNGADYNTFNLLNIKTSTTNSTSSNHYPVVFSASTSSPTTSGLTGSYNTFQDNTFSGGYYSVCMYGAGIGSEAVGNTFNNCVSKDAYLYYFYNVYQKNLSIIGCDLSRPTRTSSSTTYGIYLSSCGAGIDIENNRIHDMFAAMTATNSNTFYGIYTNATGTAAEPTKIINNQIYNLNNNFFTGSSYMIYNSSSPYCNIYHNTISNDNTTATAGLVYGIYQTGAAVGINIKNNMISIRRGGSGAKVGLYYSTNTSTISSNGNNVYLASAGTGTQTYGYWGATTYATLANWQTANGGAFESSGGNVNPGFVNPSAGDFTPTAIGCNNIGVNVGVPYDINGNPRLLSAPDPGSIEYSLPGLDASITWVSPTSPTTAGLKTITVSCNNNLSTPITSLTLTYTDGVTPVTQTFSGLSFAPSTTQTFSFTTQYNITANGTLRAYINNVNGVSDNNQGNDTTGIQNMCLQLSGTYTINSALPTGSGNFQSFTALASALNCGGISGPVVVNVAAGSGPYNEQVQFNSIIGNSAINTITINGNGRTITSAGTGDYHTVRLNGADFMTFNNLNFVSTGASGGFALLVSNLSDFNSFNNCTFTVPTNSTSSSYSAVAISSSTTSPTSTGTNGNNNIFNGCTMTGGYYCVTNYGNSTVGTENSGNQFINCTIQDFYFYGFYNVYSKFTVVKGCTITRPTRTTISTGYGIYITTNSYGCLVQDNKITNMFAGAPTGTNTLYALYHSSSSATVGNENKFINNLVSNNQTNGGVYGVYNASSTYVNAQFYHNTFAFDDVASTSTSTSYGIYSLATTGVDFRNNIVTMRRGGTGTKYCAYYSPMPATSNYNDFYLNAAAGTNYVVYDGTTPFATLAAYQSVNLTKDQQSVSINPSFNNPSIGDYKPTEATMNNLGQNVGVLTDILGTSRATVPDMGAYEFDVAPTDVGMFTFDSPGTLGCYSTTQGVTVTIKNFGSTTLDFSVNPVTVTCNVTGTATATLSQVVNAGTLASGGTMSVSLSPSFDMSPSGSYSFNAFTTMPGDGSSGNNNLPSPVSRTVGLVTGTIASSIPSICVSGTPVLTMTGNYGGNIQWQESTVGASGPWTNVGTNSTTYTPSTPVTQTTWYQAVLTCNTNTATTNMLNIIVTSPTVASTAPGSRCGIGTVNLGATPAPGTTIQWYANATGGTILGTGNTFTTPSISSTTNFYASSVTGLGSFTGMGCTAVPPSSGFNVKRGIQFDAYSPFTLNSFDFYAAYAGTTTMTVELSTSAGVVLQTMNVSETTASAAAGWHTVLLNMNIPSGTGLRLQCTFNTGSLSNYSHTSGVNYASTAFNNLGPAGLVTAGIENPNVISSSVYYYFYNLNISAGCSSPRVPVLATVNTPPSVTVAATASTICNGQSTTLSVTSPNDPNYTYTWLPGSLSGSSINVSPASTTTYTLNAIDNTTGTFATCATAGNSTITVNPVPTAITVTPASASICQGNVQTISATGGTIGGLYTFGTGTTTTAAMGTTPYGSNYEGARVQYLFTAAELNAMGMVAGSINSMAFNVTASGVGTFAQSGFTIKMAHTTATSLSGAYATPTGSFQTVFGPISQPAPPIGWYTHTFTTGFNWNGVSNVLIDICHDNDMTATCSACYSSSSTVAASTTSFASNYGRYNDDAAACGVSPSLTISTYTTRPDIRFNSATPTTMTWSPVTDLYTNLAATSAYTGSGSSATVYSKPTASRVYTVTATTSNGCTTTAISNITFKPTSSSTTNVNSCSLPYVWNGNSYTVSGTYTYTSTNAVGCDSVATLVLTNNPCASVVNLSMFIQGYYDGSVGAMLPVLANQGETSTANACDSIDVELRDATTLGVAQSVRTVLNQNGTAVCNFPAVSGSYYIAVKHRNGLQTWSANPITIASTPVTYDFTTAASQAYGDNQIEVATGVWAFYSGDVVTDENLDLLDIGTVEADINNFAYGYVSTDINGDGNVDLLDSPTVEANINNFVFSIHP